MLTLRYEEIIRSINSVFKGDFFYNEKIVEEYKKKVNKFKLREELIRWFEEEEEEIIRITEKRAILIKEEKKKYIAKIKDKYMKVCYLN